jgi:hypothetical protein
MREYYKQRAYTRLADAYSSKMEAPEVQHNIQGVSLHEPMQRRSSRTSTAPQRMNLGHEARKSRKKKQRGEAEDENEEVSDGGGSDGNDDDSDNQSQIVFMEQAINFVQHTRKVDRQIQDYVQAMPAKDKQMSMHYSQASASLDVNAMGFGQFNQSVMTQLNNAVS